MSLLYVPKDSNADRIREKSRMDQGLLRLPCGVRRPRGGHAMTDTNEEWKRRYLALWEEIPDSWMMPYNFETWAKEAKK